VLSGEERAELKEKVEFKAEEEKVELKVVVDKKVYEKISKLSEAFKTKPEDFTAALLDVLSDYSGDIASLGKDLAVSDDKRALSTLEELVFYGVESWRRIVNTILELLGAKGCYELESIDFEPLEPLIEVEFVALEGCKFKADRVVVSWSPKGVVLEAFYYLESRPRPEPKVKLAFEWSYLPDEHAILLSVARTSIAEIPRLQVLDAEVEKLGL